MCLFQFCRSVLFLRLAVRTAYTMLVILISALITFEQHTEADDNVEEMDAFEEDGALLITVVMQMQPFRDDFVERTP